MIFDKDTYKAVYDEDLNRANRIIYISSPLLSKNGVFTFIKQIASIQERGVNITVETLVPDCYKNDRKIEIEELIASLQRAGISVITLPFMYEHFSIVDDQVVWYGSMNLLSTIKVDDNIIRLNSNELAEELLIRKKPKTDLL